MSLNANYDQEPTEEAIKEFESFVKTQRGETIEDAEQALTRLQEKKAESLYNTAYFYEKSKHYESAIIYYKEVVDAYPKTSWGKKAFSKITELEKRLEKRKKK
jgi:outer membrane protein assembly factor BamD